MVLSSLAIGLKYSGLRRQTKSGKPGDLPFHDSVLSEEEVYFQSFHLDNLTKSTTNALPVANATGRIAFGNDDIFYVVTSSGWPNYIDGVSRVSVLGPELDLDWMIGSGFYGIGYDKSRDELYLANSNGFQGNGTITVFNKEGSEIRSFDTGRGPSGSLFY